MAQQPNQAPSRLHRVLRAARLPAVSLFAAGLVLIMYTEATTGDLSSKAAYTGAALAGAGVAAAATCHVLTSGCRNP